jgi:two-component system NtrC family sensor kinase
MTLWIVLPWLFTVPLLAWSWQRMRNLERRLGRTEQNVTELLAERDRIAVRAAAADERYSWLAENVPVGVLVSEPSGRIVAVNASLSQMLGYENRAELMQRPVTELYCNPGDRNRALQEVFSQSGTVARELNWRRKDGSPIPVVGYARVVGEPHDADARIEAIIADRTDHHRLEEERRRLDQEQRLSARLTAVGSLAAGIAHEINTPMQYVSDSVYYLEQAISGVARLLPAYRALVAQAQGIGRLQTAIEEIHATEEATDVSFLSEAAGKAVLRALDGIERVTRIVRAMREFAHVDHGERTPIDLNHIIGTTLTVCKNEYKHLATVETEYGDLPNVWGQSGELSQVLLNVIVNAAHAIELQKTRDARDGHIHIATRTEGAMAAITIRDNGTGMPESIMPRIFDPFFTTKEVGKGTGQGLAIVRTVIVERHKGKVLVDTKLGVGTTFKLLIPIGDQQMTDAKAVQEL